MRKWHEYTPWAALALTVVLFAFLLWIDGQSYRDRAALHEALRMQRQMLDARAEIQKSLVESACREKVMTKAECDKVHSLYGAAEYEVK